MKGSESHYWSQDFQGDVCVPTVFQWVMGKQTVGSAFKGTTYAILTSAPNGDIHQDWPLHGCLLRLLLGIGKIGFTGAFSDLPW